MKATLPFLAATCCIFGMVAQAQAQRYACSPALQRPLGQAPDACGPGFYYIDCYGTLWGPNYCLYPCFPPFQGFVPGQRPAQGPHPAMPPMYGQSTPGNGGTPSFPSHPFARGPRDFFMWNEVQAERQLRERRPNLVP